MSRFFIQRPIFAIVIALVIILIGSLAILALPIAQYPTIAPPAVSITANYPGASAETVQSSVTQVIEQQLKGLDHLIYFNSTSSSNGQAVIIATFAPGTNPDIAQVQVQNKLQAAIPILPTQVQQQGLVVNKSQTSFLLVVGLYDTDGRHTVVDVADYVNSYLVDPLSRVDGVGDLQLFGSQYAMRVWLDPYKLNNYKLMPSDVEAAILAQNIQLSAGEIGGQPTVADQALNATVTAQSYLQTPDQFKAILLKSQPDGSAVRLSDVARVELGAENYSVTSLFNGRPAAGIAIKLAPGANALDTADAVKKKAIELSANFPSGIALAFPVDNTQFVRLSINDVIKTLIRGDRRGVVVRPGRREKHLGATKPDVDPLRPTDDFAAENIGEPARQRLWIGRAKMNMVPTDGWHCRFSPLGVATALFGRGGRPGATQFRPRQDAAMRKVAGAGDRRRVVTSR